MKTVGIAFGGGGARGVAHILMIEALEELGIKPSIISGSSIGSIVGAFYAAGFTSKEMRTILYSLIYPKNDKFSDFFMKWDIMKMLSMIDLQILKTGLIKGDKFQNFIFKHLKIKTFEELQIPLKIVATEFWNKEEIIFESGDLVNAIKASYSLPGLFTPVKIKNKILVDGGIVNPLPYDIIKDECDITVAIDVTAYKSSNGRSIPPTFESVFTAYQIMQNSISRQKLKFLKPDIYIRPEISDVRVFDFTKDASIFKQAEPSKDKLKRKLEKLLDH